MAEAMGKLVLFSEACGGRVFGHAQVVEDHASAERQETHEFGNRLTGFLENEPVASARQSRGLPGSRTAKRYRAPASADCF
jgi:hypothetical protein